MVKVNEPKTGEPVSYETWQAWRERRPAAIGHFCAHCWGNGKVYEMSGGQMQFPPVPCEECFGTGQAWRAG